MASAGVEQRTWNDLTYGILSSDGRCVYSIEDVIVDYRGIPLPAYQVMAGMAQFGLDGIGGTNVEAAYSCNRLAARDLRTGKLQWELGGPGAARQAGTFFLGPPLPLMGQLYVLAEVKSEIQLLVLNPATGDLVWSQPLASPRLSIFIDPLRRWAGMSPVYADGILVCPTYSGAIVGYDLASRSFLWGQQYTEKSDKTLITGSITGHRPGDLGRVCGDIITVGQRRVILTPVDSDWLYCLNLVRRPTAVEMPAAAGRPVCWLPARGQGGAGRPPRVACSAVGRWQTGLGRPSGRLSRWRYAQRLGRLVGQPIPCSLE